MANNQDSLWRIRDLAQAEPMDIEDLAQLGRKEKACPYYATRYSIPTSQLVTMPYSMLLSKKTRESLGIQVKNVKYFVLNE